MKKKSRYGKDQVISTIRNFPDNGISLIATVAMVLFILAPALIALIDMEKKSIDFIMNTYIPLMRDRVFPIASLIILVLYILLAMRMKSEGVSLIKVLEHNPAAVFFAAAVILMLVSQLFNDIEHTPNYYAFSLGESFGMELSYFIFILFGATQVRVESHKQFLIRTQIIASLIVVAAAFVLWHTQVDSTVFYDWTPRFSSMFTNTNYYGYYLSVSVPLAGAAFLYEKGLLWKIIAGVAFAANTVGMSCCNTTGSWVAGALSVIFIVVTHLIIEKKVNWQALALVVVFAVCLFIPAHMLGTFEENWSTLGRDLGNIVEGNEEAEHAGTDRIKLWNAALDIVDEKPFLGIGFEGVKYREYVGPPYNIRPHNEFIQYALFHGIPMCVAYVIGCFAIFLRALLKKQKLSGATLACLCAAFGYLVGSFFGLTVYSTAVYLFIFLGMGYVREETKGTQVQEKNA